MAAIPRNNIQNERLERQTTLKPTTGPVHVQYWLALQKGGEAKVYERNFNGDMDEAGEIHFPPLTWGLHLYHRLGLYATAVHGRILGYSINFTTRVIKGHVQEKTNV